MSATFDGIGYGEGPSRSWSHYGYGDLRCDMIPTLEERTLIFFCQRCGQRVMTLEEAEANRLLPFAVPEPVPPPIKGFVWTGEYYERIVEEDPKEVHAYFARQQREAFAAHPEWREPQRPWWLPRWLWR